MAIIIERLTKMTSGTDDALRDIASLGLKTVVKEIQPESPLAITACNKLAPKIVAQLNSVSAFNRDFETTAHGPGCSARRTHRKIS